MNVDYLKNPWEEPPLEGRGTEIVLKKIIIILVKNLKTDISADEEIKYVGNCRDFPCKIYMLHFYQGSDIVPRIVLYNLRR